MEQDLCRRLGIPLDTRNPIETWRELMATRNEWKLYARKCDKTGRPMIAAYPPKTPFPVYANDVWWSDDWDPFAYGQDFDFNRPFFEQFNELRQKVPRDGTSIVNCENCDYNSHVRESKNCYLNSLMVRCEDVHYSYWMVETKDSMDCMHTHRSTLCYGCNNVENGWQCVVVENGRDVNDCYFSFDLKNCDHCIFSNNLVNKSYHAFNKPCTKEEFESLKAQYLNGSWERWQAAIKRFIEVRKKAVHRYADLLHNENVTGDHVIHSKNCENTYDSDHTEDACNAISASNSKNVARCYSAGWTGCEMIYKSCVTRNSIDIAYCTYTWSSNRLRYCDSCVSCQDCFGCIGLKHKQYCILNKQYTKKEYEALIPRIIEHMKKTQEWGEFFPKSISVFAYNESAANDYFPLTRDEALTQGFSWREENKEETLSPTLPHLPDSLLDTPDSITKEVLACLQCHKNYKIIAQELEFYRKTKLPIPRHCPTCRHQQRFRLRNPCILHQRTCDRCPKTIQSTYAADRPERVLCESCYLKEIY